MTSKPVTSLLSDLDVLRSQSRPKVSNDNLYSVSWFKTLKYMPVFPEWFGSLEHAKEYMGRIVHTYNTEHPHSGLGFHTPADVHFGMTGHVDDQHLAALEKAWAEHPDRFGKNRLTKKMLLPELAWINEPIKQTDGEKMLV